MDEREPSAGSNPAYWAQPIAQVSASLGATDQGLSGVEAATRLRRHGRNLLVAGGGPNWLLLLLTRVSNPLVLILVIAAVVSLAVRQWLDASIVLAIVVLTSILSFVQEYRAAVAVETLRRRVALRAQVLRDGQLQWIASEEIVPGDVVELSSGSLVPADARVLDAKDCLVNQSLLTGEAEPVEKRVGTCPAEATLAQRDNCVFMGTSVRSGWARVLVVATGARTTFGGIASRLERRTPETEFERGLRRFGAMLVTLMLAVVAVVLAINLVLHRPVIETLLFAAALAVGLSPELLPAILSITLSHGARAMAGRGVIVKRLDAIENLGSMDVLCTDKTGTLTRGAIELDAAVDAQGQASGEVLRLACLNARLQAGLRNPLDEAVLARAERDATVPTAADVKLDEIPYDFLRRRLTLVVAAPGGGALMITKGAVEGVLECCTQVQGAQGGVALDARGRAGLRQRFVDWSGQGFRVLALATRALPLEPAYPATEERDLVLRGFLLFLDPPEPQVAGTLAALRDLGVAVKVVTGDNRYVTRHVAEAIGMPVAGLLTGADLQQLNDAALCQRAEATSLFAEIDPGQKERIVLALRRGGHVVGYLGDGINDAPALHAADVGVSVDQAVDVAKEAADFVLLRHDLGVLRDGIEEGRQTFANTLKYIFITTSANFGNMISMAVASLFLPFLPLLAKQILLNNFLSDIPAMGIAGDNVDPEWRRTPHRWDIRWIRHAMLVFGLTSTCFDLLTFAALLWLARGAGAFRTGWFVESLLTEVLVLYVIRTYRPFWQSRPAHFLLWSGLAVMLVAIVLPYTPVAPALGFVPLPPGIMLAVIAITASYAAVSEISKRWFYRRIGTASGGHGPR